MEWCGRAPALRANDAWMGRPNRGARPCPTNSIVTTMGFDIGKNRFHVVGLRTGGAIALQQRWSRHRVEDRHYLTAVARPNRSKVAGTEAGGHPRIRGGWTPHFS